MTIVKSDAWLLLALVIAIVTSSYAGSKSFLSQEQALSGKRQVSQPQSSISLPGLSRPQWVLNQWLVNRNRYSTLQSETAMTTMVMIRLAKYRVNTPTTGTMEPALELPNFTAISNPQDKKQVFFEFMAPLVEKVNKGISQDRALLLHLQTKMLEGQDLNAHQRGFLNQLAEIYDISRTTIDEQTMADLLHRVDEIPTSLALAQSANESGWGTSRFAKKANNLFGIWCFKVGCGIVPSGRPEGKTYEVAKYQSVQDGVVAYIHNLNTNSAYADLRDRRAQLRADQGDLCGKQLAEGLLKYSIRREGYVKEIQDMIRHNNLEQCSANGKV